MKKNRQPGHGSRLISLLLSFFLSFIFCSAEAQTITGTVTGDEDKPINGATVTIKGTTKATSTNTAGKFSIAGTGITNGTEAWANFRRTGFQALSPNLANNNLSGGFIRRLSYPDYESSNNKTNYFAAVQAIGGTDNLTTRVFWDK